MGTVFQSLSKLPPPSPDDMKKGILNLPESTRSLSACRLQASNGSDPQTITYSTTPML